LKWILKYILDFIINKIKEIDYSNIKALIYTKIKALISKKVSIYIRSIIEVKLNALISLCPPQFKALLLVLKTIGFLLFDLRKINIFSFKANLDPVIYRSYKKIDKFNILIYDNWLASLIFFGWLSIYFPMNIFTIIVSYYLINKCLENIIRIKYKNKNIEKKPVLSSLITFFLIICIIGYIGYITLEILDILHQIYMNVAGPDWYYIPRVPWCTRAKLNSELRYNIRQPGDVVDWQGYFRGEGNRRRWNQKVTEVINSSINKLANARDERDEKSRYMSMVRQNRKCLMDQQNISSAIRMESLAALNFINNNNNPPLGYRAAITEIIKLRFKQRQQASPMNV
jgi:hypothetical protein